MFFMFFDNTFKLFKKKFCQKHFIKSVSVKSIIIQESIVEQYPLRIILESVIYKKMEYVLR